MTGSPSTATYADALELVFQQEINKVRRPYIAPDPLVRLGSQNAIALREQILQGRNWNYDRKAEALKWREESARKDENQPPKQNAVFDEQMAQLTELLVARFAKILRGELYIVDGYPPVRPDRAILLDSAFMLIGLSDCLIDREVAIATARQALWDARREVTPDALDGKCCSDVPMDVQKELLAHWQEERGQGSIYVPLFAVHYLFDIDPNSLTSEQQRYEMGVRAGKLLLDLCSVITATKQIFGWDMGGEQVGRIREVARQFRTVR